MDVKYIEDLARLMRENGLTSLELSQEGVSLKLERSTPVQAAPAAPAPHPAGNPSPFVTAPVEPDQGPAAQEGQLVLSPTVGVFYAASSPESAPFVKVGERVKKGDTLCIIEAMKLMNEIPSETDGTVAEIFVSNGQVVEFGQPLFRIVP